MDCGSQDAVCDSGQLMIHADTLVARDASIFIHYTGQVPKSPTGGLATMTLLPSSPAMLFKEEENHFIAWMPGYVAVFARTEHGTVTDFTHFRVVDIDRIEFDQETATLRVGEEGVWRVKPLSIDDQVLGGRLDYSWQVEGEAIEVVTKEGREVRVVAREPGTAVLKAKTGETAADMLITVEEP